MIEKDVMILDPKCLVTAAKYDVDDMKTPLSRRVVMLPLSLIDHSEYQPRKRFDEVAILTLADSIRRYGLLQPIVVKPSDKHLAQKQRYQCVAGERRLRAFSMLMREAIPSLILPKEAKDTDEIAIVENLIRRDLDMFEYAAALFSLLERYPMTQDELAAKLSTTQANIANKLRLLRFTPEEQDFILEHQLTERHARSLLRIHDPIRRQSTAKTIVERGLTVSRAERYIEMLLSQPANIPAFQKTASDVDTFGKSLERSVSTLQKKGFCVRAEKLEYENEIQFLIHIPKT